MNVYEVNDIGKLIKGNPYVGRGIVIGKTEDGKNAVSAYFIMGRSANSRNRVFAEKDGAVFTEPFDASKVEDPTLIIYAAVREYKNNLIVTNGDQTDTVYDGLRAGKSFDAALRARAFEPDGGNYTARISGILHFEEDTFSYEMNILKSNGGDPSSCNRYNFFYDNPKIGEGRFLHTYKCDDDPLPSFEGEPEIIEIKGNIDEFTEDVWESLNFENKVSLFVRFVDLETGKWETRIKNKNER